MPEFTPVDHDPFGFVPVDHDPFADVRSLIMRPSATQQWQSAIEERRQREQWDALKPSVGEKIGRGIRQYAQGGLPEVLRGSFGIESPDWVNSANAVLHNPDVNAAIGMALPLKGAGIAQEAASAAKPSITAYHGSPHDFDRFDLSKIGTGEGAQAYGRGLYFADSPEVAASYRNALAPLPDLGGPIETQAAQVLRRLAGNREAAIDELNQVARNWDRNPHGKETAEGYRKSAELLKGGWEPPASGRMYQVSIKADPEHFLDWDKPLNQQGDIGKKVSKIIADAAGNPEGRKRIHGLTPEALSSDLQKPEVAEAMRSAGIPGIKYLDQGSRSAGEGSRNYVVFDDKLIDILRKYGIAGIGALPAMGAYHFQTHQVDHDPFAQ